MDICYSIITSQRHEAEQINMQRKSDIMLQPLLFSEEKKPNKKVDLTQDTDNNNAINLTLQSEPKIDSNKSKILNENNTIIPHLSLDSQSSSTEEKKHDDKVDLKLDKTTTDNSITINLTTYSESQTLKEEKKSDLKNKNEENTTLKTDKTSEKNKPQTLALTADQLQPGDILLYLPQPSGLACTRKLICCTQALTKRDHGHYGVTHAAIFVKHEITPVKNEKKTEKTSLTSNSDTDNKKSFKKTPIIADVTAQGYRLGKLSPNQPLLVFRPNSAGVGQKIADTAEEVKDNLDKPYWSCCTAFGIFFNRRILPADRELRKGKKEVTQATVCSTFVTQMIKNGVSELKESIQKEYRPNITSKCTPKDLEAELFSNPNYQMLLYPGENQLRESPYNKIKNVVDAELKRLSKQTSKRAIDKYNTALSNYKTARQILDENNDMDDLTKALRLIDDMEFSFKINTGNCCGRPTSEKALKAAADEIYLYKSMIDRYFIDRVQAEEKKQSLKM